MRWSGGKEGRETHFDGWQGELLCDLGIADGASLFQRHALDTFRHIARTSDSRSASERLDYIHTSDPKVSRQLWQGQESANVQRTSEMMPLESTLI